MNNLPIQYKSSRPLAVITNDPYTFLPLDGLFEDFTYISDDQQDWLKPLDLKGKFLFIRAGKSQKGSVSRFLRSKKVADYVASRPKLKINMYSPIDPPYKINPLTLLMNSPTIAHAYENKRYFRDEFADLIRMPEYVIRYVSQLDKAASYRDLSAELGKRLVLQDEQSSGSKGTFIVSSHDQYIEAVKNLKESSSGGSVVVSEFIKGRIASVQVCITKHGVFAGGLQKQLVDTPELCNVDLPGATKWCGGVIGASETDFVDHQAREMATVIGTELAKHGYKGIFGIDLIVTPDNEVYAIEINARHTGYSALISDIQRSQGKIPFMLLNILEHTNEDYQVEDRDALPSYTQVSKPVSFMILNNFNDGDFTMPVTIEPGVYTLEDSGKLTFVKHGYSVSDLSSTKDVLILSRFAEGDIIGRGKRVLKMITLGNCMNGSSSSLNKRGKNLVASVKDTFTLRFDS